jgi:hypothetical protein
MMRCKHDSTRQRCRHVYCGRYMQVGDRRQTYPPVAIGDCQRAMTISLHTHKSRRAYYPLCALVHTFEHPLPLRVASTLRLCTLRDCKRSATPHLAFARPHRATVKDPANLRSLQGHWTGRGAKEEHYPLQRRAPCRRRCAPRRWTPPAVVSFFF